MHRNRPFLIAVVAASLLLTPTAPPASAATEGPVPAGGRAATLAGAPALAPLARPATVASPDFDGDGKADVAATATLDGSESYGIRVWYGSGRTADITASQVAAGDPYAIGGPLLAGDFNADGYTDLAFGGAVNGSSAIYQVFGSVTGLQPTSLHALNLAVSGNYRFTLGLALVQSPVRRLAVTIGGGQSRRGEVRLYQLGGDGLPAPTPLTLREAAGKIPNLAGTASFGRALASAGSQLFIGAPDATVSGRKRAGAVVVVNLDAKGVTSTRQLSQATKGVAGSPAAKDRFGVSLSARDGYLAVGADGDNIGGRSAGSVQVFSLSRGKVTPLKQFSQSTAGVPGKSENHDRFGVAVAIGATCSGTPTLVVGGPGEVIGKRETSDGSFWVIPIKKTKGCPARQLYEGHGLSGKPAYRAIGGIVTVVRNRGAVADDLVLGGGGSISEGPAGKLYRLGANGKQVWSFVSIFGDAAGR